MIEQTIETEQRKETIRHVISRATQHGHLNIGTGDMMKYEVNLPYCSVRILQQYNKNSPSIMEIAEYFNNDSFEVENLQGKTFDGMRTIYRASEQGLEEVALQGIYRPDTEGRVCPPAEITRRSSQFDDHRGLSDTDVRRFDSFLNYAKREL